jgi:hypothetical protein
MITPTNVLARNLNPCNNLTIEREQPTHNRRMILMKEQITVQVNIEAGMTYDLHDWDSRAYEEVKVVGIVEYSEVNSSTLGSFGLTHPTVLEYLKSTDWVYYEYWKGNNEGIAYKYLPVHEFVSRATPRPSF